MKAIFVQPAGLLHIFSHSLGSTQATSSGKRILAIIPGKTNIQRGKILSQLAKMQPAFACVKFRLVNVLCTITWSVHQNHVAIIVNPIVVPVQGRSGSSAGLLYIFRKYIHRALKHTNNRFLTQIKLI